MKILVWNVRGLNHPLKQKEVVNRINKLQVCIVCLLETRVKENKKQEIVDKWFAGWRLLQNYSHALNGQIWLLWRDYCQVSLVDTTDQSITINTQYDSHFFFFSAIYGCNEGNDRRRLWSHLIMVQRKIRDAPWMLAGDFNVTVHPSESSNYSDSLLMTMDMKEFIEVRNKLEVFDHGSSGPFFTWTNKHQEGFLARKLDRVIVNTIGILILHSQMWSS